MKKLKPKTDMLRRNGRESMVGNGRESMVGKICERGRFSEPAVKE